MLVLLTGGSGFLGSHVAEQLSSAGHQVRALVRKSSNKKFLESLPNVEFAYGSVEDAKSVEPAVVGVDAIVHSAGLVKARNAAEFHSVNVIGTQHLLNAAIAKTPALRRFVLVSSLAAVGPSADGKPVSGAKEPNPVTNYGKSKLAAEKAARAAKDRLPITIIRPPMIYGPRDNETFAFFQSIQRGVLPVLGDGKNTLSLIYAADAASACVRAIDADVPSGSAYFVEDGNVYVWRDALADLENAMAKRAFVRVGLPLGVLKLAAVGSEAMGKLRKQPVMLTRDKINELKERHWVCDATDTRRDLGWTPAMQWREGTKISAQWYRDNGWL
jgi:nucleoside-diphosphate-sugar epimerase